MGCIRGTDRSVFYKTLILQMLIVKAERRVKLSFEKMYTKIDVNCPFQLLWMSPSATRLRTDF